MDQNWYVIHILSGQEQKVKATLQSRVVLHKLEDKITEILIPYENVSEVRGGKKIISQRKFWPGYLFIKMEFSEETFYLVKDAPGIIGFVGASRPRPLSDKEMEAVLFQIEDKKEKVAPKVLYQEGDTVKVTDGPFENMPGLVENVDPDRGKLTVRVSIFGRETPVELEYWQVEKS